MAHRPAATLSNAKGKREAPSLSANVVGPHNSQTNRSEPAMCVSAISWVQSRKCLCAVTFPHPKHSFTIIRHAFLERRRGPDAVPIGQGGSPITCRKPKQRMLIPLPHRPRIPSGNSNSKCSGRRLSMGKHDGARRALLKGAAAGAVAGAAVCTENVIRFDCVTELLNVGADGRAAMLPHHTVGLFVQAEKPT